MQRNEKLSSWFGSVWLGTCPQKMEDSPENCWRTWGLLHRFVIEVYACVPWQSDLATWLLGHTWRIVGGLAMAEDGPKWVGLARQHYAVLFTI